MIKVNLKIIEKLKKSLTPYLVFINKKSLTPGLIFINIILILIVLALNLIVSFKPVSTLYIPKPADLLIIAGLTLTFYTLLDKIAFRDKKVLDDVTIAKDNLKLHIHFNIVLVSFAVVILLLSMVTHDNKQILVGFLILLISWFYNIGLLLHNYIIMLIDLINSNVNIKLLILAIFLCIFIFVVFNISHLAMYIATRNFVI